MTWPRKIDIDDVLNGGRPRGHDQNAVGKLNGFLDVVRDEEESFSFRFARYERGRCAFSSE